MFIGVYQRKRPLRFYLAGIKSKSTKDGILKYLEQKGVKPAFLQLFSDRYNPNRISAKLHVNEDSEGIIKSENFWPPGVRCRKWLSKCVWQQKWNDANENE